MITPPSIGQDMSLAPNRQDESLAPIGQDQPLAYDVEDPSMLTPPSPR